MGADRLNNRVERHDAGANPIRERRGTDLDSLPGKGVALPVQRLMQQELRDQHHGKQARTSKATWDWMRGCRSLGNPFAVSAGELFAHMLDDLPAARLAFERLRDDLTELAQTQSAAFTASARCRLDNPFNGQIVWQLARPTRATSAVFPGSFRRRNLSLCRFGCLRLLEIFDRKLELLDQQLAAFRRLTELLTTGFRQHQLQAFDLQGADLCGALGSNP